MLKNMLLTLALLAETFVVLGSLGYVLHQRNRGGHTAWSRRISLAIVIAVLVVLVAGLAWIW